MLEDKTRPLVMCADQDGAESPSHKIVEKAVSSLKEKGFTVFVIRPESAQAQQDFNDVLKREGVQGVRGYFKEHVDPAQTMSERNRKILGWLQHSISTNTWCSEYTKQYYLDLARKDPENTLVRWQNIIQDDTFDPDGKGRRFSEREQRILVYMEKSLGEGDYLQNTKEYYLREVQKNPEETLRYWQAFTRDFSFNPDQEQEVSLQVNEAGEQNQRAAEGLRQAHELLEKAKAILPAEDFKKLEASFSSQEPDTIIAHGQELLSAHERTIKLDADVEKFIQVFDRACDISALRSGESKTLWPVLDDMIASWKEDERFEQSLAASGHGKAAQYVEQYHMEQKRLQTKTQGYALEM